MPFVDTILIIILAGFVMFGFFFGFIHTLGSLVGTVLGIVIASRIIEPVMGAFGFLFGGGTAARVVLFIILFLLISRFVGLLFWMIERIFNLIAFIPFAKTINRLLGALLGFLEGIIVVGAILFFGMQYGELEFLNATFEQSSISGFLVGTFEKLRFLLPEGLKSFDELKQINLDDLKEIKDSEQFQQLKEIKEAL